MHDFIHHTREVMLSYAYLMVLYSIHMAADRILAHRRDDGRATCDVEVPHNALVPAFAVITFDAKIPSYNAHVAQAIASSRSIGTCRLKEIVRRSISNLIKQK